MFLIHVLLKNATFHQKKRWLLGFRGKETHSENHIEIVDDLVEKSYNNNNGKPLKSSKILRLKPNFFILLNFSSFFFTVFFLISYIAFSNFSCLSLFFFIFLQLFLKIVFICHKFSSCLFIFFIFSFFHFFFFSFFVRLRVAALASGVISPLRGPASVPKSLWWRFRHECFLVCSP